MIDAHVVRSDLNLTQILRVDPAVDRGARVARFVIGLRDMKIVANRISRLAGLALVMVMSCATAPKRSESAAPRDKDSASEKVAAQRPGAAHELLLEQDDERWGIEAARERRRQRDEAKARAQATAGAKGVDVTTPATR